MKSKLKTEAVDHPAHYTFGRIEVIDAIEAWDLGFHLGNVVKYVARAYRKGKLLQDLRKASWYLTRKINEIEKGEDHEHRRPGKRQNNSGRLRADGARRTPLKPELTRAA